MICPLCESESCDIFAEDAQRVYQRCRQCKLVFVPEQFHLNTDEEQAQYDLHQNDPKDERYRNFLSRLFTPMLERIGQDSEGLDFGCGPGPTLSVMFEEQGHVMAVYDKFYARDDAVLQKEYDFITCTEAVEHFHQPGREIGQLQAMLKPGGYLGFMTKLVSDRNAFAQWHYKNDPTHIAFFSEETFQWLAKSYGMSLELLDKDVIILRKITGKNLLN